MLLDRLLRPIVGTITPSFSTSLPGASFLISAGRGFRTSGHVMGLEEFFPKTVNIIEESEKTGRPWKARELRNKSNEDLHKLWYVLLKERNMLLTMKHEANRQRFIMPAPERMKKVKYSMHMIKIVIEERNKAVRDAKRILQERERNQRMKKIKTKGRLKL